jgi:hypothetical protein
MRASCHNVDFDMRFTTLAIALSLFVTTPVLAQDAKQPFTGSAASEAKACAAAKADAQRWVKQGKSEGRRREIAKLGECACTPTDGQFTCRIEAQVRDEVFEEEEER